MRVSVGKTLRVGPGDEVTVIARLRPEATLGRLFVFARECSGNEFSPYAPLLDISPDGKPMLTAPLTLRVSTQHPMRELQFAVDFDGYVKIMQEVDTAKDPLARTKMRRIVCPRLGWRDWLVRSLPWRPMSV